MTVINPQSISGITSITTASGSANLLTIHNNNGAERFRIDGSGNTRITSGIATSLEVASLSADAITGDISIEDKIIHTGDTNTAIRFPTADTVTVETGGSERIRVTSDGYFGVGQTPTTKVGVTLAAQAADGTDDGADWGAGGIFQLNASGSAAAGNEILLAGAHSGGLAQVASGIGFGRHNTSDWGTYLSFKTHAADTSNIDSVVERMRINSVGKVGINSTAPDGMLAIEHTSSAPNLTMRNHPAAGVYTNNYGMELRHSYGSVNHGCLIHTQEAHDTRRALDVSDSNGIFATFVNHKVGINTTVPSSGHLMVESNGAYSIVSKSINGNGGYHVFTGQANNGTITSHISHNGRGYFEDGVQFDSSGETLDTYEEGTFTGTIAQGSTGAPTYAIQRGAYTKIGDIVTCQLDMYMTSGTGNGDPLRIGGFPFTSANQSTYAFGGAYLTYTNDAFPSDIVFHFLSASTQIGMFDENSGASILGNGSGVNVFNSKEFVLTAIYKAAS